MSAINDGGPAFPLSDPFKGTGMSLRDYFAAAALQGMLSDAITGEQSPLSAAQWAYTIADAMLKAREVKP